MFTCVAYTSVLQVTTHIPATLVLSLPTFSFTWDKLKTCIPAKECLILSQNTCCWVSYPPPPPTWPAHSLTTVDNVAILRLFICIDQHLENARSAIFGATRNSDSRTNHTKWFQCYYSNHTSINMANSTEIAPANRTVSDSLSYSPASPVLSLYYQCHSVCVNIPKVHALAL